MAISKLKQRRVRPVTAKKAADRADSVALRTGLQGLAWISFRVLRQVAGRDPQARICPVPRTTYL
jgi:hypothetical protein